MCVRSVELVGEWWRVFELYLSSVMTGQDLFYCRTGSDRFLLPCFH